MEVFEFDRAAGGAEFLEHAAAADGLELVRVADEGESPLVLFGVDDESVEVGGVQHAGLVDDHRRSRPAVEPRSVRVGVVEFVEELGDGVGRHAGLGFQDTGRLGRRGEPDHRSGLCVEIGDGGLEHACLAGTGRADDEHESIVSGDRARCVVLTVVERVVA